MAAQVDPARRFPGPETPEPKLQDLRALHAEDLESLLQDETEAWRDGLHWDFENSAALVRKFVDLRALNGYALVAGTQVVGYSYFVLEDHKGLVGDLYVRAEFRTPRNERKLLDAVLQDLQRTPRLHRIESQLMLLSSPAVAGRRYLSTYLRDFHILNMPPETPLAPRHLTARLAIGPWEEFHQEAAAHLIATAYTSHVDSSINDQYRSVSGARRFLYNIIQYPGCGTFFAPASLAAFDREKGGLCGMCLASLVGPRSAHITQICVSREWQSQGLGYELLRRSLLSLSAQGCEIASLTVTSDNTQAVRLYESMGFRRIRRFAAYVWEGF